MFFNFIHQITQTLHSYWKAYVYLSMSFFFLNQASIALEEDQREKV